MKIFILDDDVAIGTVIVDYLTQKKLEARHFENTRSLIRYIEEHGVPDMLIVDYQLADNENSLDVIEKYKSSTFVVALTSSYDNPKIRLSLLKSGACDVKPKFNMKFVFDAVNRCQEAI